MNRCELVIAMPAYNEEGCIRKIVDSWTNLLKRVTSGPDKGKLVVVNDGSKDDTGKILDELSESNPYLEVVHQKNGGHGNALLHAYRKAIELQAKWVFQTDSDDQFIPEDFDLLWEKRNESNFIMGYRKHRYDAFHRLVITRIVRLVILLLYGVYLKDSNIPYRLINGSFLDHLLKQLPDHEPFAPNIFLAVLAKKSGQNLFEIPIQHKDRETGQVSIIKWRLIKVCIQSFNELWSFRQGIRNKAQSLKMDFEGHTS